VPGGGLSGQRSDCREFCEQSIEALTTKSTLDPRLRFLPQRPGAPESLFPFLGQKHPAHASIFAFQTLNKVLFDKQLQVAGEGRPVYVHVLSQAMDRDRRNLGKDSKQPKLRGREPTRRQNLVIELSDHTIGPPNITADTASHCAGIYLVAHRLPHWLIDVSTLTFYSVCSPLSSMPKATGLKLVLFSDDNELVSGMTKVRVYHLASAIASVNVTAGATPIVSGLTYSQGSKYPC